MLILIHPPLQQRSTCQRKSKSFVTADIVHDKLKMGLWSSQNTRMVQQELGLILLHLSHVGTHTVVVVSLTTLQEEIGP
jgi:hypothetical protein